jgi:glycine betaine/choline ABC-type transport system substrate-binding protein
MAIISKKELVIENEFPKIGKKITEKAAKTKSVFELAWNYTGKVVRFIFIHKSEPSSKDSKEAYLKQVNQSRVSAPSSFYQFIK